MDQGYSKEEAKQMADMAKTAGDAATKVKTFSQLIDTLKEALGSGWTETWRTVIGDFEEARELWTSVSNILSDAINKSSDARNAIVKEWADLGGRTAMIDSFRNAFNALLSVTTPIKEAFNYVFPPATAKQLLKITENVRNLTAKMRLSDSAAAKLEKTFEGLFSIVSIGTKIIGGIGSAILKLATSKGVSSLASHLLNLGAAIGEVISKMNESIKMDSIANGLGKGIDFISGLLVSFLNIIDNVSDDLNKKFKIDGFLGVLDTLSNAVSKTFSYITDNLSHFHSIFTTIGSVVSKGIALIGEYISKGISWIHDNISFGDVFTGLVGGGLFVTATKIISLIDLIKDKINSLFGKKDDNKLTQIIDKFGSALDSLHDSLQTFTTGIKATSLLAIAIAIGILAGSMDTLSKLSVEDIGKSLFAIASLFSMLTLSFKSLNKTLSKYNTKGLIKAAGSILILAEALKVLSKAMVILSGLSWGGIAKGLTGVGVGLIELCSGIKAINGVKIPLSTSLALLALAESCKMLGDAMNKFGKLSWGEIAHGLIGMGGALGEFVAVLKGLNKVSGMQSIFSGGSLLIAVQSLSALASGLSKFGQMDSDSIKRGLVGMGGSLAELATVLSAIGKIAGFSSLFAAGSILAVTQGLDDIANALFKFGIMSWDAIKQGLVGMGGALAEVGTVITAVSKLAGFSSLFGSGSVLIVIQGLGDLSNAFGNFGSMSWDEIEIGLTAMGEALGEIAVGGLANTLSIFGSLSIAAVAEPLGVLAESIKKWAGVSVPEGLEGELSSLASGITSFTFGGLGASAISESAPAIGVMADSIKKWSGVTVPDNIEQGLTQIANGVKAFTLAFVGGATIDSIVGPLGKLSSAIKKWNDVKVPKNLDKDLKKISEGIKSFSTAFVGGWTLSAVTGPIGDLAKAIKKWNDVSVPEGIENQIGSLAKGVKNFENIGDISNATNNVTGIVNAVYKINELQFETISSGLSTLSTSIQTFASNTSSLTGIGTTLTDNFIIPIQNASLILPNAVHTMVNSVTGILTSSSSQFQAAGEQATNNFVNAFQTAGPRVSIAMTSMMTSMSSTVASQSYAIVSAFDTMMTSVVSAITSRQAYFSSAGSLMMLGMSLGVSSGAALVISSVNSAMGSIATSVQTKSGAFSGAGRKLMNSLRTGINSGTSGVLSQLNTIMTNMRTMIISRGSVFMSAGVQLMNSLSGGIRNGGSRVNSALTSALSGCSATIRSYHSSFVSAGAYLGSGLVSGINSKSDAVYKAGYRLGEKAVAGEKAGQQSASPSKLTRKAGRWLGEGLIIGMKEMSTAVYSSGKSMGRSASDSITEALSSISNIDDWNVDTDPSITIHPVFDMSNIDSGLSYIDSALSGTKAVQLSSSVAAITPVSSLTNQNGSNQDVVNAINKLRKDIGSKTGNTYNLGGITYDDGSNVADAVQSLVRAAKIEGRK